MFSHRLVSNFGRQLWQLHSYRSLATTPTALTADVSEKSSCNLNASDGVSSDRFYTKQHDWISIKNKVGTVGISSVALDALGDVTFVKTPEIGLRLQQGKPIGTIRSNKASADIHSPISGTVIENNVELNDKPFLINQSTYDKGWLYKIKIEDEKELKDLLNEKAYEKLTRFDNILTIPNALCIARIAATPLIGYLVVVEFFMPACVLFAIAGLTDLLDGWIARRYSSQRSLLGSALDPVADKFLISTLFVTLSYSNLIPIILTSIVLLRDVLLVIGGFVKRYQLLEPPVTLRRFFDPSISSVRIIPSMTSKLNTVLQLSLVTLSLGSPVFGYENHLILTALCVCTGATTIYSGLQYASGKAMRPVKQFIASQNKH